MRSWLRNKDIPRSGAATVEHYLGGQAALSPRQIDFTPGELLGSVSGELGLGKRTS
jgi:formate dehydrogenase